MDKYLVVRYYTTKKKQKIEWKSRREPHGTLLNTHNKIRQHQLLSTKSFRQLQIAFMNYLKPYLYFTSFLILPAQTFFVCYD